MSNKSQIFNRNHRWMMKKRAILLLLLAMTSVSGVWGQTTDLSGVYYIASFRYSSANYSYSPTNTSANYYLCPTENWYYYQSSSPYFTDSDNSMPFMTTYTCRDGAYDATKAIWIVTKHPSEDYYYIRRVLDGKYLTRNDKMGNSSNVGRMRVHLEESPADDDNALFEILSTTNNNSSCYDIKTKKSDGTSGDNLKRKFLNITNGNQNSLQAVGKNDGPQLNGSGTNINVGGIIGLWTKGSTEESSGSSSWYLESALMSAPTIDFNYNQGNDNYTFTITDNTNRPAGNVILYTTNGDDPTIGGSTTQTYTSAVTVSACTVKAVVARYGVILTEIATKQVALVCATPVITRNGMTFSISCDTPNATLYYSTDNTTPTTQYNGPVSFTSAQLPMTVTAVAKRQGYLDSELKTFTITNGGGTESDPYLIYDNYDFASFVSNVMYQMLCGHYRSWN